MTDPTIIRQKVLAMQLCVPKDWAAAQIEDFANSNNRRGDTTSWRFAEDGAACLNGDPSRVQCSTDPDMEHVVVEA